MGLVGESGCGKSMTAMACLGLVPPPGRVTGHITVDGFDVVGRRDSELLPVRGGLAAMIFQNPGKALNPFFTIGQQLTDVIKRHHRDREARAHASPMSRGLLEPVLGTRQETLLRTSRLRRYGNPRHRVDP